MTYLEHVDADNALSIVYMPSTVLFGSGDLGYVRVVTKSSILYDFQARIYMAGHVRVLDFSELVREGFAPPLMSSGPCPID